jgi:ribosome biogenesis GTPase / thiamine phosphate phosphatase
MIASHFSLFTSLYFMKVESSGLIVRDVSGFFTVETADHGRVVCQLAGRLKQGPVESDLAAVGDRVTITIHPDGSGTIETVAERERVFSRARPAPTFRKTATDKEQVWVANPDQIVFVMATREPEPSLRKLDRFLVVAERNEIPAIICVNKIDLVSPDEAEETFQTYADIGYPLIFVSAKEGSGIEELRQCLHNKLTVLAGSSGVGKSSLLNALEPGLGLRVKAVSEATTKGMHTTRHVELFALEGGGYLVDTPGIRSLALFDMEHGELDGYFREIAPLVADCQFSDCSHTHEENCAVLRALADGRISRQRYDSYLRLREEHESLHKSAY